MGTTYSVPAEEGFLIVAYPNESDSSDIETEIKFSYWAEDKPLPPEPTPDGPDDPSINVNDTDSDGQSGINDIALLVLNMFSKGSGDTTNLWANLGSLDSYVDFTGYFTYL